MFFLAQAREFQLNIYQGGGGEGCRLQFIRGSFRVIFLIPWHGRRGVLLAAVVCVVLEVDRKGLGIGDTAVGPRGSLTRCAVITYYVLANLDSLLWYLVVLKLVFVMPSCASYFVHGAPDIMWFTAAANEADSVVMGMSYQQRFKVKWDAFSWVISGGGRGGGGYWYHCLIWKKSWGWSKRFIGEI